MRTSKTSRPSRRVDAADNRERILGAAREVLAEKGLAAEVMEIAARAGVGAGTLYRNFGAKKELIREIVREMARSFQRSVAAAADNPSPCAGLEAFIRSGFDLTERYGQLQLDLLAGSARDAYETEFDREQLRDTVLGIFRRGMEIGELPADLDVEFALAMLQGLFSPRALEAMLATHPPHRIADLAVAYYLRALGARKPSPAPQS